MRPEQSEIDKFHKWFAIECNNAAWDLTAQPELSPELRRELLYTAYASAFHWLQIGEPANQARAEMTLAHTHAILGEGQSALTYAQSIKAFYDLNSGDTWEIAFVHLELGFSYGLLGEVERSEAELEEVRKLLIKMDEEDRQIVAEELERVLKRLTP